MAAAATAVVAAAAAVAGSFESCSIGKRRPRLASKSCNSFAISEASSVSFAETALEGVAEPLAGLEIVTKMFEVMVEQVVIAVVAVAMAVVVVLVVLVAVAVP